MKTSKKNHTTMYTYLFTVTTFSKICALLLFVLLPFIGFYAGMKYQKAIDESRVLYQLSLQEDETPRNNILEYSVVNGDTLASIAEKFEISEDTIRWENNLTSNKLQEGMILKILPVTGVTYLVKESDTLESVAKQFRTTEQKIIDFPFNEFKDFNQFTLIPGNIIVVPDGRK